MGINGPLTHPLWSGMKKTDKLRINKDEARPLLDVCKALLYKSLLVSGKPLQSFAYR